MLSIGSIRAVRNLFRQIASAENFDLNLSLRETVVYREWRPCHVRSVTITLVAGITVEGIDRPGRSLDWLDLEGLTQFVLRQNLLPKRF
jgi:hypothetical protein